MRSASIPARLADAGVPVVAGDAHSITYRSDGRVITSDLFVAERVQSAGPLLNRIRRRPARRVLVVCQSITEQARAALLQESWIDLSIGDTGELVLSGKSYRADVASRSHRAVRERRRRRHAAERVCILARGHMNQRDIAAAIGVSQQAISQMVDKNPLPHTPMTTNERQDRLIELSSIAADDGLVETYWYGMKSVVEQVQNAVELSAELTVPVLAGGEVAADVLSPWRVPTRGLVYAEELLDLSVMDLVEATAEEATLTVRVPADLTVWMTAAWWRRASGQPAEPIPTVDPVVALEDLVTGTGLEDGAPLRLIDWIAGR